jgi:hypothetical protein
MTFLGGYPPEPDLAVRDQYDLRFLTGQVAILLPGHVGGPGLIRTVNSRSFARSSGLAGAGLGVPGAVAGIAIAPVIAKA